MAHNCHGKTKSHGKTNKTSWSAVGQRLLFASEMVGRVIVTVTHCSLEKGSYTSRATRRRKERNTCGQRGNKSNISYRDISVVVAENNSDVKPKC